MGDPAGRAEEAPIPPRGKQVTAAEINGQILYPTSIKKQQLTKTAKKKNSDQLRVFFVY